MAGSDEACLHPWLRVTCGVCGVAVDMLGQDEPQEGDARDEAPGQRRSGPQLFIVARGHPELVEQLKAVMGHEGSVRIIEDRRHRPRGEPPVTDQARELRKRLREEGEP